MKVARRILIAAGVVFFILFISFCTAAPAPKTAEAAVVSVPEPAKEIVMAAERDISEATFGCIFCHGFVYESVQELTADFVYFGQKVQPHVFLDIRLHSPHETDLPADCLLCHDEHAVPEPIGEVMKPNLAYCMNCHHTGDFFTCIECHGMIP